MDAPPNRTFAALPMFHRDSTNPKRPREVRVLLAEDSPTIRHHLASLINETPGMQVVGEARNGEEALALVAQIKPDVVSMDIRMPGIDGLEATRRIMAQHPTPVVVVSGLVEQDIDLSFHAIQAGALAVVEKPPSRSNPAFAEKQRQLIRTLIAMSAVSVVRRGASYQPETNGGDKASTRPLSVPPEIIAIGASAGGPSALNQLLRGLPDSLPVPIVVTQHIPNEFVAGLSRWLDKASPLKVGVATDGLVLRPGVVHLSPGGVHVKVVRQGEKLVAKLIAEQGAYRYQPSVDVLLHSVAKTCGAAAVGIILTGMGDDGAAGLLAMREAGARTIAQDEASSTVFGMPGAAIERGAAERVLPLAQIPGRLISLLKTSH
ncbi:MAG: chemotaxis-specific protein-glutamate methyltransferase CheB [bacterium]|nr:chemotaxis-specific protein-glutamate methyltransferase CheB [bacterium]